MHAGASPHLRFGPPRIHFSADFLTQNLAIFTRICHILVLQIWQNLKNGIFRTPPFLAKKGGSPPRKSRILGGVPPSLFRDFGGVPPPKNPKKGSKKAKKGQKRPKNDHFLTSRGTSGNGGPRASRAGAAHPPFF